jgi:hypothetical protein
VLSLTTACGGGPLEAAFTIKEFRELTRMPGVRVRVDVPNVDAGGKRSASRRNLRCSTTSLRPGGILMPRTSSATLMSLELKYRTSATVAAAILWR